MAVSGVGGGLVEDFRVLDEDVLRRQTQKSQFVTSKANFIIAEDLASDAICITIALCKHCNGDTVEDKLLIFRHLNLLF